jgi:hypothetical protein
MNFSDPIPQSCCTFSNQGNLLAIAKSQELYVRIYQLFNKWKLDI